MRINEMPVVDVRGAITAQRERLLGLLESLNGAQWGAVTAAPAWTVKDVVLHLLGGELSWLARNRDGETAGVVPVDAGHSEFVRGLDLHNQRWVDAARMLSPWLIIDLLQWSGEQLDECLSTVNLTRPGSVYWAGEAPLWFDLAREFTERGFTTDRFWRRRVPVLTTPRTTSTFLWCSEHSSGAFRINIVRPLRMAPQSPWRSTTSARGRLPGPGPGGPSARVRPPRRPPVCE